MKLAGVYFILAMFAIMCAMSALTTHKLLKGSKVTESFDEFEAGVYAPVTAEGGDAPPPPVEVIDPSLTDLAPKDEDKLASHGPQGTVEGFEGEELSPF
jgi:hypothetical protein